MSPQSGYLAPKVRAFVDFLSEAFGSPPGWDSPVSAVRGRADQTRHNHFIDLK
ncbi:hypothetical protein [Pelagibius sp.]|uniref:hypothetical protein n=1 Tax=Pelagibius sp. TaxID=1931238 RepID=UPI003BAE735D